ncbi:hypothetical protein NL676_012381 [Syzygium grande]|nr:hypothetical protein NL676_012381 [Syzygium grande]
MADSEWTGGDGGATSGAAADVPRRWLARRWAATPHGTAAAVLNKLARVDDSSVERSSEVAEQQQLTTGGRRMSRMAATSEDVGGTAATRMLAWHSSGARSCYNVFEENPPSNPQRKFSLVS